MVYEPAVCPQCGRLYIRRRKVAPGNWFGVPQGYSYVHEEEPVSDGAALKRIVDDCYVEYDNHAE